MDELLTEREFQFTAADFERVRSMIYERAGISLAPSKQTMVYSRLSRRLREVGIRDFASYLDALQDPGASEWQGFVNALTTNLTSFFREPYHFPILVEHLRHVSTQGRKPRIWCAAASTGEEPYSIAMTVVEALGERPAATVFASDIDTGVLQVARQGVYPVASVEALSPERRKRFFLKGRGSMTGFARVRPELAGLVEFGQVNLVAPNIAFEAPFDVIFCRNVLIYFDAATKHSVLKRLYQWLRPGGLLFVGHSENFASARDMFAAEGKTVYRRLGSKDD